MILSVISIIICLACYNFAMAQLPVVSSGTIKRFESFSSKFVDSRKIDVWIPDGYSPKKNMPYCICMTAIAFMTAVLCGTTRNGACMKH